MIIFFLKALSIPVFNLSLTADNCYLIFNSFARIKKILTINHLPVDESTRLNIIFLSTPI